jgi:hypothetical protein
MQTFQGAQESSHSSPQTASSSPIWATRAAFWVSCVGWWHAQVLEPCTAPCCTARDALALSGKVDAHTGAATAVALTSDHTPHDPVEAQRIEASGVRYDDLHTSTHRHTCMLSLTLLVCLPLWCTPRGDRGASHISCGVTSSLGHPGCGCEM